MKILNIAPHYGAGVGTIVSGLIINDYHNAHRAYSLELCKDRKVNSLFVQMDDLRNDMKQADIVLVHYWDSPLLADLFSKPLPDCRLVFYCHKNVPYTPAEVAYPDIWIDTSPIQKNSEKVIWSCGDISRFLEIQPKKHEGFNIGTVVSPKLHHGFVRMCYEVFRLIPDAHLTILGEAKEELLLNFFQPPPLATPPLASHRVTYVGKVDDIAPYLATFDLFAYLLRPDHYGTAEQVLGEAMASGLPCVVMNNAAERVIIEDGRSGYLSRSEDEYIAAIKYLKKDAFLRRETGNRGRIRAKELYNIDRMIQQWNGVFENIMKQPKRLHGRL